MNTETGTSSYVFDNSAVQTTGVRFTALPQLYDSTTIRHLETLGVGPGWSCLEVGAGGGSIARWMAGRVGPSGRVLATDIDPQFLTGLNEPPLEVLRHNITVDPLPEASFDLAHTRLVLSHLPQRDVALARIISALKPGGWLLVEEFDSLSMQPNHDINPVEHFLPLSRTMYDVMTERGVDLRLGRRMPGRLRALGLTDVDADGRIVLWHSGSPGGMLQRANFEQMRDEIMAASGMSDSEFDAELARLDDPNVINPSSIMWSVWGRRP
jgi:SAM-dependent methyltransferase